MSGESVLAFGLMALEMKLISKEQYLEGVAVVLNERDLAAITGEARRTPAALHVALGHLAPDQAETVKAALEADPGAPARIDPDLRRALLDLFPPAAEVAWLASLAALSAAFRPVPRDERFALHGEIARGGLGRVLEATDRQLDREVAVKLVLDGMPPEITERFVREAKLTARLDHPNIVPVYDFDVLPADGAGKKPVLCMKRIRGRDLGTLLTSIRRGDDDTAKWTRARLLSVFQGICLGVAYAHSKGVIHRDLKPSNVMIGDFGEVLIVDWGLAKDLGESEEAAGGESSLLPSPVSSPELTMDGDVLGTPSYMSPEQAAGKLAEVDARSDIYALGGILFTVLAYRSPYAGASKNDVIRSVLSGRVPSPSRVVAEARAVGGGERFRPPDLVPPELESICLRALAFRREDRYATARELHDEIQLFLEGVKERERAEKEARERVEKGRGHFKRYRDLAGEIEAQGKLVKELTEKVKPHEGADAKRPLWDAEARLKRLEDDRIEAFAAATAEFGQALVVRPDLAEALDAKCELYLDRFLEAERKRDRKEMLLARRTLEPFDREGHYRAKLDAPGKLSLRTFAYSCGCLAPVRHPEWRVEIAETCTIPWRDGRARPDLPLTDKDRLVPAVKTFPEGVRWGHTAECPRHEVRGAEVWIAKYEERDKRLHLGELKLLGTTPLANVELPQGSWRCTLKAAHFADTLLPVRVDRALAWTQDVNLYRPDEIPPGFCNVPGGPFVFGGEHAGGGPAEARTTEDLFVAKFPVTAGEYLEFLNALCVLGQTEEARKRQPREGDQRFFDEAETGWRLPPAGDPKTLLRGPDYPVFGVSWHDAIAYLGWRSKRDGIPGTLMHEEEWEKAARGVDARIRPYGDDYDGSYSHTNVSVPEGIRPMPVGSFLIDESPYGIRDLGGGVATWLINGPEKPYRDYCCARGGAWGYNSDNCRAASSHGYAPTRVSRGNGVRLAVSPRT